MTSDDISTSYDVSLTWTRADVDVLAWLLTWLADVPDDESRADVAFTDMDVLAWLLTGTDDVIW